MLSTDESDLKSIFTSDNYLIIKHLRHHAIAFRLFKLTTVNKNPDKTSLSANFRRHSGKTVRSLNKKIQPKFFDHGKLKKLTKEHKRIVNK